MDIDRRIAAARRRIFAAIDARCAYELLATAIAAERAIRDINDIATFHRRSAGQRRRFAEARRMKGHQ